MRPRWSKILADLWSSKGRTILVVLAIAVGVFAVGMVSNSYLYLLNSSNSNYESINPASTFIVGVSDFDEDLLNVIRKIPEIDDADGRRVQSLRISLNGEWFTLQLSGIDFDKARHNLVEPITGVPAPNDRQLLIDQSAYFLTDFAVGDTAIIELRDGKQYEMPIVGTVRDFNSNPSINSGAINAYVTPETFEWFGQPTAFNYLTLTPVENHTDYNHAQTIAAIAKDAVEAAGYRVGGSIIMPEPGVSPINFMLNTIQIVLGTMAIASLAISAFLVFNTMSALLLSQTKQIGIMKAIGASVWDLIGIYLILVVAFGILAFIIAVLPAAWASEAFAKFIGAPHMMDIRLLPFRLPKKIIALELLVAIVVPVLGALPAVLGGARISVLEAISSHGLGDQFGQSLLDNTLSRVRTITGPTILSIGNIFRNKQRVALTLGTLVLGGGVFIGVISAKASADRTVDELSQANLFDIEMYLTRPQRASEVERLAMEVEGVVSAEGWFVSSSTFIEASGDEGNFMNLLGVPQGSEMARPKIIKGRWLLPDDKNAIVVDSSLLRTNPDLEIGDSITLKINGREESWTVVGIYQLLGFIIYNISYVNQDYLTQLTQTSDRVVRLRLNTTDHQPAFQNEVAARVDSHLRKSNIFISQFDTNTSLRRVLEEQFGIMTSVLIAMSMLITLVGGLGLAGTMSMNVMERMREIGVMRAVGASNRAILRIVMIEGLLMALMSWFISLLLAWPVGVALSQTLGKEMVNGNLRYVYSIPGALIWLVVVMVTAAGAGYGPALRASRLTVRDVLAYE